jgi:NAD-dependent deacetylase
LIDRETDALCAQLAAMIADARKVMVFTGAGISTESGIPDFRSPGGLWSRFDPDDFTIQKFLSSEASRKRQWQLMKDGHITEAQPNAAHDAVAELYRLGKLDCVVTQNIDSLHQKAGVPDGMVYELHGNNRRIGCLNCGARYDYDLIKARLLAGEEIPDCERCHGLLKPEVVFFGEALPVDTLEEANRRAAACDLCIVIGSTLVVYPAAYVPAIALQSCAKLAIINLSETPMDDRAHVLIEGSAGEVMTSVLEKLKARLGAS